MHTITNAQINQQQTNQQQPGLFDRIIAINGHGLTLEQRFDAFHAANPHVYQELRRLALQLTRHGHRRIGIGMIYEVLRWQYILSTKDTDNDFKLNNNYRAFYARLLMDTEPELAGVFETRTQTWRTVNEQYA